MSFGLPQDVTASATWVSATPGVALVGLNTGLATGVGAGTSSITATFGGVTSPAATLSVTAATVVSIAVTPPTFSIAANGNKQFTATATMSFGLPQDVTASATWASATPSVALVGLNTGLATGVGAGTSAITATFGGVTSPSATLSVTAATVVSISVTPPTFSIAANGNKQFTATATMSFGLPQDVTASATWVSATPGVALVGLNTGVATGVGAGTSAITATFGGVTSPSATLSVTAATVVSISVTPSTFSIAANGNNQFTATATMSFGLPQDVTASATWASGTLGVASIGLHTGLTTGVAAGTSAITATFGGVTSPSATLTVTAAGPLGPQAVNLGTAGNFVILAETGITTTGATTIVGNIGVSPIAATAITGFGLIADPSNVFSTSSLVTGKVYAANYAVPTPSNMTTAISDMQTAFNDAAGRPTPDFTELSAGNVSGMTLVPGLYKWGTGVLITNAGVTLSGGPNDVWIFQIAQDLTVSNGAFVTLSGGAQAKNVFWQISGKATLGTGVNFSGIILSQTLISLNTGASLTGRALAQTAVTLNANNITTP